MTEQELRALVREAVERHLSRPDKGNAFSAERLPVSHERASVSFSHVMLEVPPGSDLGDGMCVIEPSVRCNHCGFCRSYGH